MADVDVVVVQPLPIVTTVVAGTPGAPGPPGADGPAGPPGADGPPGPPGQGITVEGTIAGVGPPSFPGTDDGELWLDATGDGWVWDGSGWINVGPIRGPEGAPGAPGAAGATGPQGVPGTTGATGAPGTPGAAGATGPAGPQGNPGATGSTGAQGPKGDTGATGAQGVQGDPGAAGATGAQGVQGVPGTTGAQGPQGDPGPTGPSGQAAGKMLYLAASDASDIATYKTLLESPSVAAEQTIATPCTGTADVLVAAFATDPGSPGAVDYPAGTGYRRIYANVQAGTARFHLQVYKRNAAGVETLIRDEFSSNFVDQVATLQQWTATAQSAGAMLATDRIVAKLYAQRITGPTTVTVTTYYEGTAHTSQVQTTISAGAQGPVGATGPTGATGPKGDTGDAGAAGATGPGVATGGTTGQALVKTSATNFATGWATLIVAVPTASWPPASPTAGVLYVKVA